MNLKNSKEDKELLVSPEVVDDAQELSEEELEDVSGGKVSLQDFHFTKKIDKASPTLSHACVTGKHFPTGTITTH